MSDDARISDKLSSTRLEDCRMIMLPTNDTGPGSISWVNNRGDLPFPVRRVYYLYDIPTGAARGGHAHRGLMQLVVAASGSFDLVLDDGRERSTVTLKRPDFGILIVPGVWRELESFSAGSVCLVLASEVFDEQDYIRDYGEFALEKKQVLRQGTRGSGPAAEIHPMAEVNTRHLGPGTQVWQYAVILSGARIGSDCNINCHVFIENDVIVGDRVTVKSGVQLWDGLRVEDDVFIGPNVTFTNDFFPRSRRSPVEFIRTRICKAASIGANATILPGVVIGKYAMIGAGSVVTKDVPDNTLWYGNPARHHGFVSASGEVLDFDFRSRDGRQFQLQDGRLVER